MILFKVESGVCNFFTMSYERASVKDQLRQLTEEEMLVTRYSSESDTSPGSRNDSPFHTPKRGVSPFKRAVLVPSPLINDPNACVPLFEKRRVTIKTDSTDEEPENQQQACACPEAPICSAMSEQCLDLIDSSSSNSGGDVGSGSSCSSLYSDSGSSPSFASAQRVPSRKMKGERAQATTYKPALQPHESDNSDTGLTLGDLEDAGAISKDVVTRVRKIQPSSLKKSSPLSGDRKKIKHMRMTLTSESTIRKSFSSSSSSSGSGESIQSVERSASASLTVEVPPKIISSSVDEGGMELSEGGTAVITVSAIAQPSGTFKWMKGNLDVKESRDGRVQVRNAYKYCST